MTRSFRPSITRILVELGETNMRCALLDRGEMHDVKMYKLADHVSLADAIRHYCKDVSFTIKAQMGLLVALAPQPQTDGLYFFKYQPEWNFKARDLMSDLNLASIHLLNDLESHAYAVMAGARGKLLFPGTARKEGPIAIVAPGTGLGFAYVYPELQYVQQTFGAHMNFFGLGKNDPHFKSLEGQLLFPSTSFEDIISGPGLKLMKEKIGEEAAYEYFAKVFGLFLQQSVFFANAIGGIVITGGLIPALLKENRLNWNRVREAYFVNTIPAATTTLADTPWHLIDDPLLGLKGLVAWAGLNIDDARQ